MDPVKFDIFGVQAYFFLWLLTLVSIIIFANRVYFLSGIFGKARSENRNDGIFRRLLNFAKYVLGQRRLFNDKAIGLPHFLFLSGVSFSMPRLLRGT